MAGYLVNPPVAFIVIFLAVWIIGLLFSKLAYRPKNPSPLSREPYACGEKGYDFMAQPDYSKFFPYAFFFTLAHVATLIMATMPVHAGNAFVTIIYLIGAMVGLYILFRR